MLNLNISVTVRMLQPGLRMRPRKSVWYIIAGRSYSPHPIVYAHKGRTAKDALRALTSTPNAVAHDETLTYVKKVRYPGLIIYTYHVFKTEDGEDVCLEGRELGMFDLVDLKCPDCGANLT